MPGTTSPIFWLRGESPWGRELDCYREVLIDDTARFDPRQRKFAPKLEKWIHSFNGCFQEKRDKLCALNQSCRNVWEEEQQPGTWRENLKHSVKWDRSVFAFPHPTPPLSCGQSTKACRKSNLSWPFFKKQNISIMVAEGTAHRELTTLSQNTGRQPRPSPLFSRSLCLGADRGWQKQD